MAALPGQNEGARGMATEQVPSGTERGRDSAGKSFTEEEMNTSDLRLIVRESRNPAEWGESHRGRGKVRDIVSMMEARGHLDEYQAAATEIERVFTFMTSGMA